MPRLDLTEDERAFARFLGATIRHMRTKAGLKREALALAADCSHGTLSEFEGGNATPSVTLLMRIGRALQVSSYDIIKTTEGAMRRAGVTAP